jgi:plastocyanin
MRKARVLVVGAVLTLAACGGGGDGGDDGGGGTGPAVFTSMTVTPATVTVAPQGTQALTASAIDQRGQSMSGLTTTYASSDQAKATVSSSGVVTGVAVGTAKITVTGTIGSVTKTKDVDVTVSAPGLTATVAATTGNQFDPSTVVLAPGGTVTWNFAAQHNVTFQTSGAPANIDTRSTGSEARTFPNAGTYNYICTIHGQSMSGVVRVQ